MKLFYLLIVKKLFINQRNNFSIHSQPIVSFFSWGGLKNNKRRNTCLYHTAGKQILNIPNTSPRIKSPVGKERLAEGKITYY